MHLRIEAGNFFAMHVVILISMSSSMSSHVDVRNVGLYQDRTVQDWHRDAFPSTYHAIDLDLMGCCHLCREPLYLIEATTNPEKGYSILRRLALRSNLPGFVVYHDREQVTSALHINDGRRFNREGFEQVIHKIRQHHAMKEH